MKRKLKKKISLLFWVLIFLFCWCITIAWINKVNTLPQNNISKQSTMINNLLLQDYLSKHKDITKKIKDIVNILNEMILNHSEKQLKIQHQLSLSFIKKELANWNWIAQEKEKFLELIKNYNLNKSKIINLLKKLQQNNFVILNKEYFNLKYNLNNIKNNKTILQIVGKIYILKELILNLEKEKADVIITNKYKTTISYLNQKYLSSLIYQWNLLNKYKNWFNNILTQNLLKNKCVPNKSFKLFYYNNVVNSLWKINYTWYWNIYNELIGTTEQQIKDSLDWIKLLIIKKYWKNYNKILQDNYLDDNLTSDYSPEERSKMIKFSSIIGIRNLWRSVYHPEYWYHPWIDITIANRKSGMWFNCKVKNKQIYQDWINKSDLDFSQCKNNSYQDYKSKNTLAIKIDLNYLKKNNLHCYIWKNRSIRVSHYLVWFWNFLICEGKNNIYSIYWHLNPKNKIYNTNNFIKNNNLSDLKKLELNQILWSFYEPNYLNFDKKTLSFKWLPEQALPYFTSILWKNLLKEVDLNKSKYLYILMWSTGKSFWDHIHFWMSKVSSDNNFVWILTNNKNVIGGVNHLFWIDNKKGITQMSLKFNHYWFLWLK